MIRCLVLLICLSVPAFSGCALLVLGSQPGGDGAAAEGEASTMIAAGLLAGGADGSGPTIGSTESEGETSSGGTSPAGEPIVSGTGGLVWQGCGAGQNGAACAGTAISLDHAAAFAYCASLNALHAGTGYAGRADWRLPTVVELGSLVDYASFSPAIDSTNFSGTHTLLSYWTSVVYPSATGYAFGVEFNYGTVSANIRSGGLYTRCVAGTTTSSNFTDQGDGTVVDATTALTWTRCSLGAGGTPANGTGFDCSGTATFYNWQDAVDACAGLIFAGHSDWRLPGPAELMSIVDYSVYQPTTSSVAFPNTMTGPYWTSGSFAFAPVTAWRVDFFYGLVDSASKSSSARVRCVR